MWNRNASNKLSVSISSNANRTPSGWQDYDGVLASSSQPTRFKGRSSFEQQKSQGRRTKFRSIRIDSFDRGNWVASIRPDLDYLSEPGSYGVGEGFSAAYQPIGDLFRNFFTFRLPRLKKGEKVVKATLRLTRGSSIGDPVETFGLFDVSSSIATLNNTEQTSDGLAQTGVNPFIYDDLGTGKNYGLFNINTTGSYSSDISNLRLNSNAVKDINRSRRRLFGIGGSLQSLNTTTPSLELLFARGNSSSVVQLVLRVQSK